LNSREPTAPGPGSAASPWRLALAPALIGTGAARRFFIIAGRGRILWGERLDYAAEVAPGDFVYFAPQVPHEEINLDGMAPLEFVVVRSDGERIFQPLDIVSENSVT